MPRFFFDIRGGVDHTDDEGVELPDASAAIEQAMRTLPRVMADEMEAGSDVHQHTVVIRDGRGNLVYVAEVSFTGERFME